MNKNGTKGTVLVHDNLDKKLMQDQDIYVRLVMGVIRQ